MYSSLREKRKPGLFSWDTSGLLNTVRSYVPSLTTTSSLCRQQRNLSGNGYPAAKHLEASDRPGLLRLDSQGESVTDNWQPSSMSRKNGNSRAERMFNGVLSVGKMNGNCKTFNSHPSSCPFARQINGSSVPTPSLLAFQQQTRTDISTHSSSLIQLMLARLPCPRSLQLHLKTSTEELETTPGTRTSSQVEGSDEKNVTNIVVDLGDSLPPFMISVQKNDKFGPEVPMSGCSSGVSSTVLSPVSIHLGLNFGPQFCLSSKPCIEYNLPSLSSCMPAVDSCRSVSCHKAVTDFVVQVANSVGDTINTFRQCHATSRHYRKRPRFPCRLKRSISGQSLRSKNRSTISDHSPKKSFFLASDSSDSGSLMSDNDEIGCNWPPQVERREYDISYVCESFVEAVVSQTREIEASRHSNVCDSDKSSPILLKSLSPPTTVSFFSRQDSSSFACSFIFSAEELDSSDSCSEGSDEDAEVDGGVDSDDNDDWVSSGFSSPSGSAVASEPCDPDSCLQDLCFGGLFLTSLCTPTRQPVFESPTAVPAETRKVDYSAESDVDGCGSPLHRIEPSTSSPAGKAVSSLIERLNSQWNEFYQMESVDIFDGDDTLDQTQRTVQFSLQTSLVTVPNRVEWADAYVEARCGPWEEFARDRVRFERRVRETDDLIGWIFHPDHRARKLAVLTAGFHGDADGYSATTVDDTLSSS